MKTNARAEWDRAQIARAVEFTTSRFLGQGIYDTRRFATRAQAEADACGDRRAMLYAVTPEGWSIHICNGDTLAPKETTMTELTKTYANRSNAVRAARSALKETHRDPMSGVHFVVEAVGEEFAWHEIDLTSGQIAVGERIADGAKPYEVKVTQCPPAAAEGVRAPRKPKVIEAPATPDSLPVVELADDTRSPARKKADAKAQREGYPNATRANEAKRSTASRKANEEPKAAKAPSKKAAAVESAQRGELPEAPDFSKDTHKRFRKTLEDLVAAAQRGDLKALKADKTEPKSSSRVALCRYRDLAITALEARKRQPTAA